MLLLVFKDNEGQKAKEKKEGEKLHRQATHACYLVYSTHAKYAAGS
jgi:hypothetical protein